MNEGLPRQSMVGRIDRCFRRKDTFLANGLRKACSLQGTEYRNSKFKRNFELTITAPVALLSIPVTVVLGLAAKAEDGGSMFFFQERVGKDGKPVTITKIRTMHPESDTRKSYLEHAGLYESYEDPRNTRAGRVIRASSLDELPQLWQVLKGSVSLIDVRCITQYSIDLMQSMRPKTFEEWHKAYTAGTPGILNLYSATRTHTKHGAKKHHYDMLYAKKATLGMDLFIIFRTVVEGARRFKRTVKNQK